MGKVAFEKCLQGSKDLRIIISGIERQELVVATLCIKEGKETGYM